MTFILRAIGIYGVAYLYVAIAPDVTSLPFGAEEALQIASNLRYYVVSVVPFLGSIWQYAVWILSIEIALFGWKWFKVVISWL